MFPKSSVSVARLRDRRTVVLGLLGSGLTLTASGFGRFVPAASAGQEEATPSDDATEPFSDQVFAGAGFVGKAQHVPAGEAYVGVVIAEPAPGAETREARALIYGESANGIMEWFPGAVTGDQLDLVSDSGARLTGEWTADGVTGEITLVDGTTVDLDLVPAIGIAGLYTMTMFPGGHVEGASERGATLIGQLIPGSEDGQHGRFAGTFTAPDGEESKSFDLDFAHLPEGTTNTETFVNSGNARLVVLADGQFRGGARKTGGGQFSWPCID